MNRAKLMAFVLAGLLLVSAYKPTVVAAKIATQDWRYAAFPVQQGFQSYSSLFGWRPHPISGGKKMHWGLDIAAAHGSPILSWWEGAVTEIGNDPNGWGNYVVVVSGDWEALYAHCSDITAKQGQKVKAGQEVAKVGATGGATGDHLHWEMKVLSLNERVDPMRVVKAMYAAKKTT